MEIITGVERRGRWRDEDKLDTSGFGELYRTEPKPGPVTEAACWAHFRRKVFELAEIARAPLAAEAVRRIDPVFGAERAVNGCPAADRLLHRRTVVAPLVADLHAWLLETRGGLSRHNALAKALDYALKRWDAFSRFVDDGRVCLTNNVAERALRGVALSRKAWLFAGSDRGGERAAVILSLSAHHSKAERRGPQGMARGRAGPDR